MIVYPQGLCFLFEKRKSLIFITSRLDIPNLQFINVSLTSATRNEAEVITKIFYINPFTDSIASLSLDTSFAPAVAR
jgi:hypothetical protein